MPWNVPPAFTPGQTLTAAALNAIRDSLNTLGGAWATYTPSWTATVVAPSIEDGTLVGYHMRAGRLIHFRIVLTGGASTDFGGGPWVLGLPVDAAATSGRLWVTGTARDDSASNDYLIGGIIPGGPTLNLRTLPATAGNSLTNLNATTPFTWAAGDTLTISGTYEAAS